MKTPLPFLPEVLELIQKHKKEVQARMANHEHGFRAMLERSRRIEANHGYREPEKERPGGSRRLHSENSRIVQRYSTAIEKDIQKSHGVRASIGPIPNLPGQPANQFPPVSSDEYFELPKNQWPEVSILTDTEATNSPINSSPNVEEVNWYDPDQLVDMEEGLCKKDDDDNENSENNNESVSQFATRIRFNLSDESTLPTGRRLSNAESDEPFDTEANPSTDQSSQSIPTKSSKPPSHSPSKTSSTQPSQSASKPSSKESSQNPSKSPSKHTKKSAKTAKSQSSHNQNQLTVPQSDDGGSSSDQDVSVNSSYYSSTSTTVWQDVTTYIGDNFWVIVLVLAILILIVGFLLAMGNSPDKGSGSSGGSGGESNKGNIVWHKGPVM